MSFAFSEYVRIDKEGNKDIKKLEEWVSIEAQAMKLALAGDQQLNSGVKGAAEMDATYAVLKWALR
jgi:hypothetical protein